MESKGQEKIMINIALIVAVLIGLAIAFQPITNAAATRYIGLAPLMVISNGFVFLGAIAYALLASDRGDWTAITKLRPDLLLGGASYGLLILFGSIYVFPRLGATLALMVIILSQLAVGLLIDNFGLYGMPREPFSWTRIWGIVVIVVGVLITQIKST